MTLRRTTVLTVAGGLLVAVVLFAVTAPGPRMLTTPIGMAGVEANVVWHYPGADPWTGEYRPLTKTYTDVATGQPATKGYRDDYVGRRAGAGWLRDRNLPDTCRHHYSSTPQDRPQRGRLRRLGCHPPVGPGGLAA